MTDMQAGCAHPDRASRPHLAPERESDVQDTTARLRLISSVLSAPPPPLIMRINHPSHRLTLDHFRSQGLVLGTVTGYLALHMLHLQLVWWRSVSHFGARRD